MFNWIEDFSKKVAKKKLEGRLDKLVEVVEKYNFPKQSFEHIGGFIFYYDNFKYFLIRSNDDNYDSEDLLHKKQSNIYLTGAINEKIDYIKIVDSVIEAIENNSKNQTAIKKVGEQKDGK